MTESECVFCKIAGHKNPAEIDFENDFIIAFKSITPVANTHIIIIPKEHITSFTDLEEKHKDTFTRMAEAAQTLIKEKNISGGYKLVFNGGKYQSIPHIHWHLLGGVLEEENNVINKT